MKIENNEVHVFQVMMTTLINSGLQIVQGRWIAFSHLFLSIIFPRHQIWCLSYNLVTPIEAHSCITKHHIFNQKAQQESSVLQDCSDIKITYMSQDKIFVSIELTPNGHVTLLV